MYATRITAAQLQPLLSHGWCYGDVLITQDALECCQLPDDLSAILEHHMDLGFFLCGLDRATKANVSQFTSDGKPVKSAFVLETGVLNIITDPVKGVTIVSGSDEVCDLD
jgi:hypothetical protein